LIAETKGDGQMRRVFYQNLPLSFERNEGQAAAEVDFIARQANYIALLDRRGMTLGLRAGILLNPAAPGARPSQSTVNRLRINFVGALGSQLQGADTLSSKVNYFLGNDPAKWHTNVPTYARVTDAEIYHGVDLVFYGSKGNLEYDLMARPGSDPHAIRFSVDGAQKCDISAAGDLVMTVGTGELRLKRPTAHQSKGNLRQAVPAHYVLTAASQVGIEVGAYDHSRTLVIDPRLEYSTFLGGTFDDGTNDIAVDRWGNAYVT